MLVYCTWTCVSINVHHFYRSRMFLFVSHQFKLVFDSERLARKET